jgi:branched-chain amino acid transport system substrate-binding protein
MKKTIIQILFALVFGMTFMRLAVEVAESKNDAITVGVLANASYAFAEMMKGSFNLAMQRINDGGGIYGRKIKLVFADDNGDKKTGIQAVHKLAKQDHAAILVGGYSSSNTLVMAREADRLDIPFLVCTAADDRITQRKYINIFRLNPPASDYTKGLEDLLVDRVKPASMAIIYENSPYGTGGAMRMMWFCRENDIEIKAIVPYHKERAGASYFDRLIAPLKKNAPEIIFMVSYLKDAVALVRQIRAAKINALLCGGAGGFTHPDFIKMAGKASRRLLTATLWTADQDEPLAKKYADRYRALYKQTPDYHGAEAYSALMVVADSLRRSKSQKAHHLRDALGATDMNTPFGRVTFKSYGQFQRQNRRMTLVLQAMDDGYKCVWPTSVSVTPVVLP